MLVRAAHRVRWALFWILIAAWSVGLVLGLGGGAPNLLLLLAIAVLVYELLAVDRPA